MTARPTDAQIADAGRMLAEAVRTSPDPAEGVAATRRVLSEALAAYDATVNPPRARRIAVLLPETYLGRDVRLRVGKDGSRWIAEAEDAHGQLYDVQFDGFTGRVRFATQGAVERLLADHGHAPGDKVWAAPAVRS